MKVILAAPGTVFSVSQRSAVQVEVMRWVRWIGREWRVFRVRKSVTASVSADLGLSANGTIVAFFKKPVSPFARSFPGQIPQQRRGMAWRFRTTADLRTSGYLRSADRLFRIMEIQTWRTVQRPDLSRADHSRTLCLSESLSFN